MALRGTLRDFGIADIFQLIGHQGKSGVLAVKNGDQHVDIHFSDGSVVRADSATRDKRDLLGHLLVRAEVLSEEQLQRALEAQKRTLRRLGQILVENGALDRKVLATFTRLQTTETIYRLFFWSSGSYEFIQKEIATDAEFEAIKSESILMEGFRQLDEWPAIRRKVTSYSLLFERVKELDALVAAAPMGGDDLGLGDAFQEPGGTGGDPALKNIGQNERLVYQLIAPERDVQKLIDLSRLGEFETCKALERLIDAEFIVPIGHAKTRTASGEATVGGIVARGRGRLVPVVTRVVLSVALVAGAVFAFRSFGSAWLGAVGLAEPWGFRDTSWQAELAVAQQQRIERALAVFEAVTGGYPATLDELVVARLLESRDLRFPWEQRYVYRREQSSYLLLRPLY